MVRHHLAKKCAVHTNTGIHLHSETISVVYRDQRLLSVEQLCPKPVFFRVVDRFFWALITFILRNDCFTDLPLLFFNLITEDYPTNVQ